MVLPGFARYLPLVIINDQPDPFHRLNVSLDDVAGVISEKDVEQGRSARESLHHRKNQHSLSLLKSFRCCSLDFVESPIL